MTEKKTICPCGGDCKCDPCECPAKMAACSSSWCGWGSFLRIALVVLLITGAYACGVWNGAGYRGGYDRFDRDEYRYNGERGMMMEDKVVDTSSDDMMRRHCETMPNMAGCEKYSGVSTTMKPHDMMQMNMSDMGKMLEGMTGDTLDRAFLEGMIPHHQAAVDMAKYLAGSDKPELVKLGSDIITAQTKEIEQMQKWMKDWGYTSTGSTYTGMMMDQSMMR